jgi:hypothetical protein
MNSAQRIQAAIRLEPVDRVPVAPWLDLFAASYTGLAKDVFISDSRQRFKAVLRTALDMGPWDMTYLAENASRTLIMAAPARVYWPGRDVPADEIHQFEELEVLVPEDYGLLRRWGLLVLLREVARRLHPEVGLFPGLSMIMSYTFAARSQVRALRNAGIEPAVGFMHPGPLFEYWSLGRSLNRMCTDLYDRPEAVRSAGPVWARAMTRLAICGAVSLGVKRVFVALSRSSPAIISPVHFEEFVYPDLKIIIGMLLEAGITPVLHCDTRWTERLAVFRRFPAGRCIIELDGDTDIITAGDVLGGHMCLKGNVPASLTAFGTKDDVLNYCRRLIETLGRRGGFILSSGCSLPANARVENVRAIFEAAEEWGRSG